MIKAVLFDLDGTLIDTNELIYKSFCHTFKQVLNLDLPRAEITRLFGKPLDYTFANYTNKKEEIECMINTYRSYNESLHDNMCFAFDEVEDLLLELKKRKIKIGIVTSKRESLAKRGMKIAGIIDYMDVIVTPEYTKKHKPEAEPALYACKELGIEPSDALMVGDSHYDLLCGKSAGCKTCGVNYTALEIDELRNINPDYFIDKPMDIIKILDKNNI